MLNKIIFVSIFIIYVLCFFSINAYNDVKNVIDKNLKDKQKKSGGKFQSLNLKDNINYQRENNYELFVSSDGKLSNFKVSVDEPRQILKANVPDLRYTINDAEVVFNVYPIEPKYEKKILRETLKKPSLCFILVGLLIKFIDKINVDHAPIFGLIIKGTRNKLNINNLFDISVVLANVEVPLGSFSFPETKELFYQLPFLINYYENLSGYNRQNFSFICALPNFAIDVLYTSTSGVKFNFNGEEHNGSELFPITVTYFNEHSKYVPVQESKPNDAEVAKAVKLAGLAAHDTELRTVSNAGPIGKGLEHPAERILIFKSFSKIKFDLRNLLASPANARIDQISIPFFFLLISQKVLQNEKFSVDGLISIIDVSNIKVESNKNLKSFILTLTTDNGSKLKVECVVKNKVIPVPTNLSSSSTISAKVPEYFFFYITKTGLTFSFGPHHDVISKLFDYKLNNLSNFVTKA